MGTLVVAHGLISTDGKGSCTVISLESVKLGTSNFVCWLILSTIASIIDFPKGYVQGHLTSLTFWDISHNIS